jgi:hypothetical protein
MSGKQSLDAAAHIRLVAAGFVKKCSLFNRGRLGECGKKDIFD